MKKFVLHVMATTGITEIVLSVVALCFKASWLRIDGVFQSLLVNVAMHMGILLLSKVEYRYPVVEAILKVGCTLLIVLAGGWLFDWYAYMPIWCLVLMTVIVYVLGVGLGVISMLEEVKSINALLEKRDAL